MVHAEDNVPPRIRFIALGSLDLDGRNTMDEPKLLYLDALKTAKSSSPKARRFVLSPTSQRRWSGGNRSMIWTPSNK